MLNILFLSMSLSLAVETTTATNPDPILKEMTQSEAKAKTKSEVKPEIKEAPKTVPNVVAKANSAPKLIYFSKDTTEVFNKDIQPLIKKWSDSANMDISFVSFAEKNSDSTEKMIAKIKAIPEDTKIIVLGWNEKKNADRTKVIDEFNKLTQKGVMFVAAAGVPQPGEGSCDLAKTLWGSVDRAVILGELQDSERLVPMCFYGPEMLTALRLPDQEKGRAPLYFVSHLLKKWNKNTSEQWLAQFRKKKMKSKKIWPEMNELITL